MKKWSLPRDRSLFVGADPNTGWLGGYPIELDTHGFVRTGHEIAETALEAGGWSNGRRPGALECLVPGVFAIGDMRAESALSSTWACHRSRTRCC